VAVSTWRRVPLVGRSRAWQERIEDFATDERDWEVGLPMPHRRVEWKDTIGRGSRIWSLLDGRLRRSASERDLPLAQGGHRRAGGSRQFVRFSQRARQAPGAARFSLEGRNGARGRFSFSSTKRKRLQALSTHARWFSQRLGRLQAGRRVPEAGGLLLVRPGPCRFVDQHAAVRVRFFQQADEGRTCLGPAQLGQHDRCAGHRPPGAQAHS